MTNEPLFNLIYAGAILSGFNEEQVKQNFISKLNIPEDKVSRLFSGKSIILKKSLTQEKAEKWQQKLLTIGVEVVSVPAVILPLDKGIKEADKVAPPQAPNSNGSASQTEYDQDMQERINKAKAMIAAQMMEQQLNTPNKGNSSKRLVVFSVVMAFAVVFLYFYAGSIT